MSYNTSQCSNLGYIISSVFQSRYALNVFWLYLKKSIFSELESKIQNKHK